MTPALALFYAGFVRSRNVLNTMVMSFAAMGLVSVLWVLFGYSLAFSPGSGPWHPSSAVGNGSELWIQLQAAGFTLLWVGVGTFAILKLLALAMPLRASDGDERQGLDIMAHGEEAYNNEFTL